MKSKKSLFLAVVLILGVSSIPAGARAGESNSLTDFFSGQIESMDSAVGKACQVSQMSSQGMESGWFIKRFWLRARVKVGVQVPGIANALVIPELELLWDRNYPEGWTGYKPSQI